MKNDCLKVNLAADCCIPACSNILPFQPVVMAVKDAVGLMVVSLRCAYEGRLLVVVLLLVYNSIRTRTELLGTNQDSWIISVEFSSFLTLPYPDSKANFPDKGLSQLASLVLIQEGHHGSCMTHQSSRGGLSCECQAGRGISCSCEEVVGGKYKFKQQPILGVSALVS